MLNIKTLEQKELPDLNQARYGHASLILNGHLFVMGGNNGPRDHLSSIECIGIAESCAWNTLLEGNQLVKRS